MAEKMMKSLVQKYPLGKNTFVIESGWVNVHLQRFFSSHRFKVPFEEITPNEVEASVSSKGWFTAVGICVMFLILTVWAGYMENNMETQWENAIFWGLGFVFSIGMYMLSRRTYVVYSTGSNELAIIKNNPDNSGMQQFVENMLKVRAVYLRNAYLPGSDGIPIVDQLRNLCILKDNGDITKEEFELVKKKLLHPEDSSDDPGQRPILGFGDN